MWRALSSAWSTAANSASLTLSLLLPLPHPHLYLHHSIKHVVIISHWSILLCTMSSLGSETRLGYHRILRLSCAWHEAGP